MEWNWFFSAVAQSTAALIGFFGAFLVSKLINTQSEYRSLIKEMRSMINKSLKLKQKFSTKNFTRYNNLYPFGFLKTLKRRVHSSEEDFKAENIYRKAEFSPFEKKSRSIEKIKNAIEQAKSMSTADFSMQAAITQPQSKSRKKFRE